MDYQTTEIINTENIKFGASQIFYRYLQMMRYL